MILVSADISAHRLHLATPSISWIFIDQISGNHLDPKNRLKCIWGTRPVEGKFLSVRWH